MSGEELRAEVYGDVPEARPQRWWEEPKPLNGSLPLTDVGNAERLAGRFGTDLRFVPGLGWHAWDGRRWRRDTDGEVTRRMVDTVRAIGTEATATDDDGARKKLLAHALRSEAEARIRAAVALAAADERIVAQPEELDAHPLLLNVGNGTLNLRSGRLLEHDRGRLLSRITRSTTTPPPGRPRGRRTSNVSSPTLRTATSCSARSATR